MFRDLLDRVAMRGAQHAPIPPLDGALTPNDRLRTAEPIAAHITSEPRGIAVDHVRGILHVTDGNRLLVAMERDATDLRVHVTLPGQATGAALGPDGRLLVGIEGLGLMSVGVDGDLSTVLTEADGRPLRCLTDVAVDADGQVFVTEGSQATQPREWYRDLMAANAQGRIVRCRLDGSAAQTVHDGLAFPSGVAFSDDASRLVFTESWRHRVWAAASSGDFEPEPLAENLPGYPARIHGDGEGGFWLAVFALRTQLIEFVLEQRDYCDDMMERIDPDHWIRPEMRPSTDHAHSYLVPLQHGALVALGQKKQSAPPRTYGLVLQLDANGTVMQSLHDREGGPHPGAVAAVPYYGSLLVASEGGRRLLHAELSKPRAPEGVRS